MVRKGLTDEVIPENGRSEEASHMDRWGKNVPGKGNSKCKGLKLSILGVLKNSKVAIVTGPE